MEPSSCLTSHNQIMADLKNDKKRRPLKTLPPEGFQPKVWLIWIGIVAALVVLYYVSPRSTPGPVELKNSELVQKAMSGDLGRFHHDPRPLGRPGYVSGRRRPQGGRRPEGRCISIMRAP